MSRLFLGSLCAAWASLCVAHPDLQANSDLPTYNCAETGTEASCHDDEGPVNHHDRRESLLLQQRRSLDVKTSQAAKLRRLEEAAAWVVSGHGNCEKSCSLGGSSGAVLGVRLRTIECRSLFENTVLDDSYCASSPKPTPAEPCDCDFELCDNLNVDCKAGLSEVQTESATERRAAAATAASSLLATFRESKSQYEELGCLKEINTTGSAADVVQDIRNGAKLFSAEVVYTKDCLEWKGSGSCNQGLPFFRLSVQNMTEKLCFRFCLSKGLDIFGISNSSSCRCGASVANGAIWHGRAAPKMLTLASSNVDMSAAAGTSCTTHVYRYSGPLEGGSMPFEFMNASLSDTTYIDSIVLGHTVRPELEEDLTPQQMRHAQSVQPKVASSEAKSAASLAARRVMTQNHADPTGADRSCYPDNCGPGGGPWMKRQARLMGGLTGRWQEYSVIPYSFDPTLDDARKTAFRKATKAWIDVTCVSFVEVAGDAPAPSLWIDAVEPEYCYTSNIGYPGDDRWTALNLGWCNSDRYVGNIVHELGHVLGMNHEQKRPDAVEEYNGHGPYLNMHWDKVEDEWVDQYHADMDSYVGSANDGTGDPFSGWAEYDFSSIMHYPVSDHFDTIPASSSSLTGNRQTLSSGDILQVLDQYQCKLRA